MLLAAILAQAVPMIRAPEKPVVCSATPAPLPPGLAGWTSMVPVSAGASGGKAPALPVGRGLHATLLPADVVRFPAAVVKPAAAGSSGGVFAFTVATAGRYQVALGAGVWVDVVASGKALPSVAHGHGPACSPVRKIVSFDLNRGRYLLQVAGSTAPTLALMVARAG